MAGQKTSSEKSMAKARKQGRSAKKVPARGRRFTEEQRQEALKLLEAGMSQSEVSNKIGTTPITLWRWGKKANGTTAESQEKQETPTSACSTNESQVGIEVSVAQPMQSTQPTQAIRSPYAPADPGQGLAEHEVAAILEYKRLHPSMGPAQIRAQLKRFKGWRISLKAIARVLRGHGYELVHRKGKPQGPDPIRFEAPRRNALWQADFAEVRVADEKLYVLIILDDFSRFVVGHALADSPSTTIAVNTLMKAIARHGKPESVRTDRGGAFVAFTKDTDFGRYLEAELIDHIVGRSYSPRGGGKVESAVGTLRRELWEVFHFEDRHEAEERLKVFFDEYNERRAHMGIDGLTPADRFFGRADRVLATVNAISRKRQGTLEQCAPVGAPIEEVFHSRTGAPLEVLRLVLIDGVMELRFCGARVKLGRIEP
jgi:transposase InsO family protein/transposase-like protein